MFARCFISSKQRINAFNSQDFKRILPGSSIFSGNGIKDTYETVTRLSYSSIQHTSDHFKDVFSDSSKDKFIKTLHEIKCKSREESINDAAVLVPLCKVNSKPSVLLTLRSSKLGRNKGDVSFPGGMRDRSDKNVIDSALRETAEEIGLSLDLSQIWTTMPSVSRHDIKVTPVIAFIGEVNLKDLVINEDEVENVFSLTLESLCDPRNQFYTEFRPGYSLPVYLVGQHRVWGLTAGILHHILRLLLPEVYVNNLPILYTGFKPKRKKRN